MENILHINKRMMKLSSKATNSINDNFIHKITGDYWIINEGNKQRGCYKEKEKCPRTQAPCSKTKDIFPTVKRKKEFPTSLISQSRLYTLGEN